MLIYYYGFKGNCDFSEAILMSKLGDRNNSGKQLIKSYGESQAPSKPTGTAEES